MFTTIVIVHNRLWQKCSEIFTSNVDDRKYNFSTHTSFDTVLHFLWFYCVPLLGQHKSLVVKNVNFSEIVLSGLPFPFSSNESFSNIFYHKSQLTHWFDPIKYYNKISVVQKGSIAVALIDVDLWFW